MINIQITGKLGPERNGHLKMGPFDRFPDDIAEGYPFRNKNSRGRVDGMGSAGQIEFNGGPQLLGSAMVATDKQHDPIVVRGLNRDMGIRFRDIVNPPQFDIMVDPRYLPSAQQRHGRTLTVFHVRMAFPDRVNHKVFGHTRPSR